MANRITNYKLYDKQTASELTDLPVDMAPEFIKDELKKLKDDVQQAKEGLVELEYGAKSNTLKDRMIEIAVVVLTVTGVVSMIIGIIKL